VAGGKLLSTGYSIYAFHIQVLHLEEHANGPGVETREQKKSTVLSFINLIRIKIGLKN
jgi:hypothetical protein